MKRWKGRFHPYKGMTHIHSGACMAAKEVEKYEATSVIGLITKESSYSDIIDSRGHSHDSAVLSSDVQQFVWVILGNQKV